MPSAASRSVDQSAAVWFEPETSFAFAAERARVDGNARRFGRPAIEPALSGKGRAAARSRAERATGATSYGDGSTMTSFPSVPPDGGDARRMARVVQGIMDGKTNNQGTVTLAPDSTSTTLMDPRIGPQSVIAMMPTTASAAVEIGSGTLYVSARGDGAATLTHASNAQDDRIFGYAVIG